MVTLTSTSALFVFSGSSDKNLSSIYQRMKSLPILLGSQQGVLLSSLFFEVSEKVQESL
jgi:hypothetical protein